MKTPVPSRRFVVILAWVAVTATLLLIVWLYGKVASLDEENQGFEQRDRQSIADRRDLRERLDREETAMAALAEQLRTLGEQPVVEPNNPPPAGQLIAIPGPRGLSCIEQLGFQPCRGDQGRTGAPGDDSNVPGPEGATGAQGPKGEPGDRGPEGPAGPAGPAGADGKDGADGRGLTNDTHCGDDGRWVLAWTDGTTTDGGICRLTPGDVGGPQ